MLRAFERNTDGISALHELPLLEDLPELLVQGLLLLVGQVPHDLDVGEEAMDGRMDENHVMHRIM